MMWPLKRSIRRLRHRFSPGAMILVYHRVAESLNPDQSPLNVTPTTFSSHLAWLRRHTTPIGLTQLVHLVRNRQVPKRAVAVTFDDGYANNLYFAKPLLERYDIPATVFVTTGTLGGDREFWWDELRKQLGKAGSLPETFSLTINGTAYHWNLDDRVQRDQVGLRRHWQFGNRAKKSLTTRERTLSAIHTLLKWSSDDERRQVLEEISRLAGSPAPTRRTHLPMTANEVNQLAEGGLVEIGAHTVTHPVLSSLSLKSQEREIRASKLCLEEVLGQPVRAFAYPYGSRRDYTAETVKLVQEAGFDYACSNFRDIIFPGIDYYQLPRIPVRNWDEDELGRQLGIPA